MSTKAKHPTDLLNTPGMKFDIDIPDPKQRIQAYIDEYANPINPEGQEEVSQPATPVFLIMYCAVLTSELNFRSPHTHISGCETFMKKC